MASVFLFSGFGKIIQIKMANRKFRRENQTVAKVFAERVKQHPDKIICYYREETWTFRQMDHFSTRVANAFIKLGYQPGDEVSLFMQSSPEFIGIWLGLSKAGMITALVNTNQRKDCLLHAILSIESKAVIYSADLEDPMAESFDQLFARRSSLRYYRLGKAANCCIQAHDLSDLIEKESTEYPESMWKANFEGSLDIKF